MNEITFAASPPIDGYGPGGFRVAGRWREGSIILLPSGVHSIKDLSIAALAPLLDAGDEVEVVLVGMGSGSDGKMPEPPESKLPPDLRKAIREAGPEVETMSTPSACRTYNVLLAENRRVAAVLMTVSSNPG